MMTAARVTKMHGAHNVFVVLDERPVRFAQYEALAKIACDPAGELGAADGLLVVRNAAGFEAEMLVFNADGSQAEMCGNGVRCVARYLAERGAADRFTLKTLAGPIGVTILARGAVYEVRADVGRVVFPGDARPETVSAAGATWTFYDVSLGNPHAVIFVDDVAAIDLVSLGTALGAHPRFPRGTNVHVVQLLDAQTIRVRHFERGVGLTAACGTGAVAAAAAAIAARDLQSPVTVHVPGGTLRVDWKQDETARLTGPAETIFERTIAP